jgi:CRP-like cAMP-binding protein/CheY-like chemotaxis protein
MADKHPADIAAELKAYSFFNGFPDEALLVFATMAFAVEFSPGHLLLEQGKTNDSLFFLRSGELAVEVDGEIVSKLNTAGEVVGEMSLINRRPVTANVKAVSKVEVFQVSESHLQSLPAKDIQKFQRLLYRVYASVLAERLTKTNVKAKQFEIAHRGLEAAHESLRKINENLENEIARRSKELVQKVHNLIETHLQPTQKVLSGWAQADTLNIQIGEVQHLLRLMSEVVDFLKPVADLGLRGKNTESQKVLLCDPNKKQQTVARLALGGTGVELALASSLEELELQLMSMDFDLILCDAELKEGAQKISKLKPNTPLVLLVNLDMGFYLQALKDFPHQPFFVSRDVNDRTFTIKNISTTVAKILNQDFFGMDKYLAWGAHIIEKPVSDSSTRLDLIEKMKEHFKAYGIRTSILDRVHAVSEELLMNAIYDAPTDKNGKSLYNHLTRSEKVVLSQEHEGRYRYGTDGVLLAVSVVDPFGALSKDVIMKYLESCYAGKAGELNEQKGGAGRGLHMIIESADLTIFNIKKGSRTEVISLFNLDKSRDEIIQPTFHLFLN